MPLLVEYSLPLPQVNKTHDIGGEQFELDFAWPAQRFAIEADGGQFHDNPEATARDSHRNEVLAAAGWRCGVSAGTSSSTNPTRPSPTSPAASVPRPPPAELFLSPARAGKGTALGCGCGCLCR